jgi:hypothetical protein
MTCGVCGVTARLAGVFCRQCEFGVACVVMFCLGEICWAVAFGTLGGETAVCTLGGALLSSFLVGGTTSFALRRVAP